MSMSDDDVLTEARKRFQVALDADDHNRKRALDAIRFRFGEQWPEKVKHLRENDPNGARPCLTLDKTNQYIRQVVNDQRQNRPAVKVRPVDDKGDPKVAEILQGAVRNIEEQSFADIAYDTAIEGAADGGFGYFRIITEYASPGSFDQCIRILRVRNRFTVYLDPAAIMPEASDAKWGFVTETIPKDEAERRYGDKRVASWYADMITADKAQWCSEDGVRIAEYFVIRAEKEKLVLLSDGRSMLESELAALPDDERLMLSVEKERDTEIMTTWHYKLAGTEVLEKTEFPAPYIPILRVVGNEHDIEGRLELTGMIDVSSMDAQRMFNYAASAFVERVALEPTAPYIAADTQVAMYTDEWNTANRRNVSVLRYEPQSADGHLVPAPQRQQMAAIPAGWMAVFQQMEHSIQAALGMYSASLGESSNERSGRAILARQKEGDTATFHYIDNLSRAIRHGGRIIVKMIPKVYTAQKLMRIIGEDGKAEAVRVDFRQQEAVRQFRDNAGAVQRVYNPGLGEYDVAITIGPSYSTKRQEGAAVLSETVGKNPQLMQIAGDLFFRALDVPYADELADRMKKMLPPQLQEDQDDENLPPAAIAAIRSRDMALAQAQAVIQELQPKAADNANAMAKTKVDSDKNMVEAAKVQLERERLTKETDVANQQFTQLAQGLATMAQAFAQLSAQLTEAQAKNNEAIQAVLSVTIDDRDMRRESHEGMLGGLRDMGGQIVSAIENVQRAVEGSKAAALQLVRDQMGEPRSIGVTQVDGTQRDVNVTIQ